MLKIAREIAENWTGDVTLRPQLAALITAKLKPLVEAAENWRKARDENPRSNDYLAQLYRAEDGLRRELEKVK